MSEINSSLKGGFVSGLLGSLCCVGPLVLVLLGLSGVSGAMALSGQLSTTYRWSIFIPLAIIFLLGSMYFHIKRKAGVCNVKTIKHYKSYVLTTIVFAVAIWVILLYILVPLIFTLISGW